MGTILTFTRLKIGEVITLEVKDEQMKCQVMECTEKDTYKLRILEGKYRGKFCYFTLQGFEDESNE